MRVLTLAVLAALFTLAGLWGVTSFAAQERNAVPESTRAYPLASLGWLAGCWRWQGGGGALAGEEQWMAPAGGLMMGMSRTRRGDRVVEHEFLRIAERDGALYYIANPSGQRETAFRAAQVSDTLALFENPQHDFPQRIAYQRLGVDSLVATVSVIAPREGQAARRPLSFRMARVACP